MNIYTDEISGLKYIDFEDIIDESQEISPNIQLIINNILITYIHNMGNKLKSLNEVIRFLQYDHYTYDELIIYKYRLNDLYFDILDDYDNSKNRYGYWRYLGDYTIEKLYNKVIDNPVLQLYEIFEDNIFLEKMMQIGGKYTL